MDGDSNEMDVTKLMRPPETVMRLDRIGSFHQSRLSFMRSLLRRMKRDNWTFSRPVWRINGAGVGIAVYQATGPHRSYSLVCFSHDLDPAIRTDRSIATEWDATFTLFDGIPTANDLVRLENDVPKQEAGRVSESELSISRANKSVRLFEHVVERLSKGRQPDLTQIEEIGYLMRTTAVYGSGKFGAASRDKLKDRPEVSRPFHMEMLSVFLTRAFTADLVEHLAAERSPETSVKMDPVLRRRLGVGNSTGLGMAPFLVNHPKLLHNWVSAREIALARVRSQNSTTSDVVLLFRKCFQRAAASINEWKTSDQFQTDRIAELVTDLDKLGGFLQKFSFDTGLPWNTLFVWAEENLGLEAQELLASLLIEPHGDLVDDLLDAMSADEETDFRIFGQLSIGELRNTIAQEYAWALPVDYAAQKNCARFWYVSANKAEPRLGERIEEPDAANIEEPLDIGRGISNLNEALSEFTDEGLIADFLLKHPRFRKIVRRIQTVARLRYGEIRDNLISSAVRPIDMLRCKLSFFGAIDFDPRSDRWVRITMFKNAPYPHELDCDTDDNWAYSPIRAQE